MSLKNAFAEIGKMYESQHGVPVIFNFAASGALARQIIGGAPVDVFASAAPKDMDEIADQGLIFPETRLNFAGNRVVLVVPVDAPVDTPAVLDSFEGLAAGAIRRIAAGNPKTVPAGRYADEVFRYYGIDDAIAGKLIFTENVRQALDYVARGEVDAGVVYGTDAAAEKHWVRIAAVAAAASHRPVVYPIAVLKDTHNKTAAMAFIEILLSPEGKKILLDQGFGAIEK
jgi:molybdate transport system substrate-binding protein